MFNRFFFQFLSKVYVIIFIFFLLSFNFTQRSAGTAKSTIRQVLFFWLIIIMSGCLAKIRWSVCISESQRSFCVSFSRRYSWLCIYHLFVWSNLNFLHTPKWINLLTLWCLILFSICANSLHSLMWLVVSSLSSHNLHLLFCCILSILALIWLVLMAMFCAAIRRDSVYLLKFPFLSLVHVFSCKMMLISLLKRPCSCFSFQVFFFWLYSFCWFSCCQYCFWWLYSAYLRAFHRLVSMRHNIIIVITIHWEFFISVWADGFSLESVWQQNSSSFQDSSQYFGRFQQCRCLDCLHSSSYF